MRSNWHNSLCGTLLKAFSKSMTSCLFMEAANGQVKIIHNIMDTLNNFYSGTHTDNLQKCLLMIIAASVMACHSRMLQVFNRCMKNEIIFS